jgi:hypothetical protein
MDKAINDDEDRVILLFDMRLNLIEDSLLFISKIRFQEDQITFDFLSSHDFLFIFLKFFGRSPGEFINPLLLKIKNRLVIFIGESYRVMSSSNHCLLLLFLIVHHL